MPWITRASLDLEAITDAVNRVFEFFIAPTCISAEQMGSPLYEWLKCWVSQEVDQGEMSWENSLWAS